MRLKPGVFVPDHDPEELDEMTNIDCQISLSFVSLSTYNYEKVRIAKHRRILERFDSWRAFSRELQWLKSHSGDYPVDRETVLNARLQQ